MTESDRELENILRMSGATKVVSDVTYGGGYCSRGAMEQLKSDLRRWKGPEVTRNEIQQEIEMYLGVLKSGGHARSDAGKKAYPSRIPRYEGYKERTDEYLTRLLIDRLLALLHGTSERVWCEHLKPFLCLDGSCGWRFEDHALLTSSTDSWDQCPVAGCHAPRPKEG